MEALQLHAISSQFLFFFFASNKCLLSQDVYLEPPSGDSQGIQSL